jgi:hypothetical protein
MNKSRRSPHMFIFAITMLVGLPSASPAQVRVLISGGFSAAYQETGHEEPTQRMAARQTRIPKAVALRTDRIACRRFQRRSRLVTRGLRESIVGSSNCLLVGKITISVKGSEAPRRTASSATHESWSRHAAVRPRARPPIARETCMMVARW